MHKLFEERRAILSTVMLMNRQSHLKNPRAVYEWKKSSKRSKQLSEIAKELLETARAVYERQKSSINNFRNFSIFL